MTSDLTRRIGNDCEQLILSYCDRNTMLNYLQTDRYHQTLKVLHTKGQTNLLLTYAQIQQIPPYATIKQQMERYWFTYKLSSKHFIAHLNRLAELNQYLQWKHLESEKYCRNLSPLSP